MRAINGRRSHFVNYLLSKLPSETSSFSTNFVNFVSTVIDSEAFFTKQLFEFVFENINRS